MQFSNINYNLYKSFLVVYETKNISRAADILYISQPAVSHNIKELEKQSLTRASSNNLVNHAYSVNDRIKDSKIRNLNVNEFVLFFAYKIHFQAINFADGDFISSS
mgnify:CR=1 FL=1